MSYDPELFRPRPSEALLKMAKETLEEVGSYPDLQKQLDDILKDPPPSSGLEEPQIGKGLY